MPRYRIHRLEPGPQEGFRWAAHTGGLAIVKRKDYQPAADLEAATPYAAWIAARSEGQPLSPGDLLEEIDSPEAAQVSGALYIAKYIGFEPAQWFVPESRSNESGEAESGAAVHLLKSAVPGAKASV